MTGSYSATSEETSATDEEQQSEGGQGVKVKKGGIDGITLDVTFDVEGVNASGLQIVQVVFVDGESFVDGGVNSPWAKEKKAISKKAPYYLTKKEARMLSNWNGTSGTIRTLDQPTAVFFNFSVIFETGIIARNYNGSGMDKVLGVFRWGFEDESAIHNGIELKSSFSDEAIKVIYNDYPKYKFYDYE